MLWRMNDILQEDVLFALTALPEFFLLSKFKFVGMFCVSFMSATFVPCGYVLLTNLEKEFWKNYSLLALGAVLGFSCYVVIFWKKNEYLNLVSREFPKFWSPHCAGKQNYRIIRNSAKLANIFVVVTLVSSFSTSTAGLPWIGDEYDIMLPVKVYTDYFGKWKNPISTIYYLSVYHGGFTMMATAFVLIHFCLHLKIQFFLLKKRLQKLYFKGSEENEDLLRNNDYQIRVTEELKSCIQYHQYLLRVITELNDIIYLPIFMVTTSSILFSVSLVFYLKDFDNSFIRGIMLAVTGGLVTSGFCISGQLLQDASLELHTAALFLPWHLWNMKNRKLYLMLLIKSQTPAMISSSGIIVINHTLFIALYRTVTSVLSFFMNV
ncbi:hypothetical protein Zmor_022154 [Zophobas morio]|uniref:Odorant receptor n=1 Tax=Zophobas morio TaxID=2755281 RepID=A0AA38M5N7_9CUCU|nr:hypothetical protein Zmor_022154 [Zophobas morio]